MRDKQIMKVLATWNGFSSGLISSEKPLLLSSLSEILESETSAKYYLSPKACSGILRRAEKRGKALPPSLRAALLSVASEPTSIATADSLLADLLS